MLGRSSSGGTEMASLTRVGLSFSTVVVTMSVLGFLPGCTRIRRLRRVGATGFEPAASRSQSGRSTKLSYAPRSGMDRRTRPARSRAGRVPTHTGGRTARSRLGHRRRGALGGVGPRSVLGAGEVRGEEPPVLGQA